MTVRPGSPELTVTRPRLVASTCIMYNYERAKAEGGERMRTKAAGPESCSEAHRRLSCLRLSSPVQTAAALPAQEDEGRVLEYCIRDDTCRWEAPMGRRRCELKVFTGHL